MATDATRRRCYSCGIAREPSFFSATNPKDYLCRPCRKEYDRLRKSRATGSNTSDAARARKRRWINNNRDPFKESARMAVRNAVKSGALIRPNECEDCGNSSKRSDGHAAIQAHHDDYNKPLNVRWLCPKCHTALHKTAAMEKSNEHQDQ